MSSNSPLALSQRGRSSLDILGSIQKCSSGVLREQARANFRADPKGKALTEAHGLDASHDQQVTMIAEAKAVAEADPIHRLERFFQRYVAEENFVRGIRAIEEKRDVFTDFVEGPTPPAGGTLELDPDLKMPDYYDGVEFHLEPGGWDGYDLYGPVLGFGIAPRIFKLGGYAAVGAGADIVKQRFDVVKQLPKTHYARIYEPGCGGISTLGVLASVFPDAELVGSDLSPGLLQTGHTGAERRGIKVHLKQRDSVHSGEPDESFDAVVTYALHHELPPADNVELFKEMFRIMKPGADIVISDPPPFRAVEPFHAVILDWDTVGREEPYFTAAGLANWDEELRKIGFVDVESYGLGADAYPWVTRARKPG